MNDDLFDSDGEFRNFKYLVKLLGGWRQWWYIVSLLIAQCPLIGKVNHFIMSRLEGPLVDFLGDVVLYCSMDQKSKYYEVRQTILKGSVEKTKYLIESAAYDDVYLVGHSLGTVIAYDTLDRINREMNVDPSRQIFAQKIKGLMTFGSSLDKIAFFLMRKLIRLKRISVTRSSLSCMVFDGFTSTRRL